MCSDTVPIVIRSNSTFWNPHSLSASDNSSEPNRWGMLLQALTGNMQPYYACEAVAREGTASAAFVNEYKIAGRAPYDAMVERLQSLLFDLNTEAQSEGRLFEVPVAYGGEHGEDLAVFAQACGLTEDKVIEIHSATTYFAFSLGFAPGFAYLGSLDPKLRQPRLDKPRVKVPCGSVGVANGFTGVYPLELPGGWHLIGRTPWRLFDASRDPPALLAAGDRVRFRPIAAAEFAAAARKQPWR